MLLPMTLRRHRMQETHQVGTAIGHCGIDYLSLTRVAPFQQRGKNSSDDQHPAATEVAYHIKWNSWFLFFPANGCQCTGQRYIIYIMAGCLCKRATLAPARHARVDKPGVVLHTYIGSGAQSFHDAWPEAFQQYISCADQLV